MHGNQFCRRWSGTPAIEETHSIIGLSLHLAIAKLLNREPDEQVHWLTQRYKENFVMLRQAPDFAEPLYDGILPLLSELGARMTFCSVS